MEVMDVHNVFDGAKAKLICSAVGVAAAGAAAGEPAGETIVVVVAAIERGIFRHWRAAEFAAPQNKRAVQQTALAEVGEERRERLVPFAGEFAVVFLEAVMVVPRLAVAARVTGASSKAAARACRCRRLLGYVLARV